MLLAFHFVPFMFPGAPPPEALLPRSNALNLGLFLNSEATAFITSSPSNPSSSATSFSLYKLTKQIGIIAIRSICEIS